MSTTTAARNEHARIVIGSAPALDDRTVSQLRDLASELEVEVEAEAGSGSKPVKADLLRDLTAALEEPRLHATTILRAGVLAGLTPDEISERVLDALPDSSFQPSWVKSYLGEWKRQGRAWWQEHADEAEGYLAALGNGGPPADDDGEEA